ncbi:MAG TPA: glutathione S-transferase family protein [Rhizomicrobium sp.]|nr:glutathione S-transferase family protein [Rhizomicrobium sp.]
MTLKLYYHPLSSFCWKVLIALYEKDIPFEPVLVDLQDAAAREKFLKLWPIGKFPVIRDEARDWLAPESTIIIEYLDRHYPGRKQLIPSDPDLARQARMRDRFFDLHVQEPMQKIVGDRIRPDGGKDPFGVAEARARLKTALGMIEADIGARWIMGEEFTLADCAAMPALFYADKVSPLKGRFDKTLAYLERLKTRPAVARTLKEAEPYMRMFPEEKP